MNQERGDARKPNLPQESNEKDACVVAGRELGHRVWIVWGRKAKGRGTGDRGELLGYDTTLETGKEPEDVIQTDNTRK